MADSPLAQGVEALLGRLLLVHMGQCRDRDGKRAMVVDAIGPMQVRIMTVAKNDRRTCDRNQIKLVDPKTPDVN